MATGAVSSSSATCNTCTPPAAASIADFANLASPTPNYGGDAATWQYSCQAGYFGSATTLTCRNTAPTSSAAATLASRGTVTILGNGSFTGALPNCTACNAPALGGGYYCNGGTDTGGVNGLGRYPCLWGSYSLPAPAAPAASPACSPCLAGYYCPNNATTTATFAACGQTTFYCPAGSRAPLAIPAASYGTPAGAYISALQSTTSSVFSGYAPCPANEVCSNGFIQPPVDFTAVCGGLPTGGALTISVNNGATNMAIGPALTPTTPNPTGSPLALNYFITNAVARDAGCTGANGVAALLGGLNVASAASATPGLVTLSAGAQLLLGAGYTFNSQFCPSGFSLTLTAARVAQPSFNATCSISVLVAQTIQVPTWTSCGNVSLTEHSGEGADASPALAASTTNFGTQITYAISSGAANFLVSPCTGVVSSATDLAWVAQSSYPLVVTATNNGQALGLGSASSTCAFFVNVVQKVLPAVPTVTLFVVPELSPVGAFIGNLQIVDPAGYAITSVVWGALAAPNAVAVDAMGNLTVAAFVDTLALLKTNWVYKVNVTNAFGARSQTTVTVSFSSVPRAPVVLAQAVSIASNATAGTATTPALLQATSPGGIPMTFAIAPSTVFSVNVLTGALTLNSGQSLRTASFPPAPQSLTLTCTSAGGSTSAQVTVNIVEVPLAPIFNTQPAAWAFTVPEGSVTGTGISAAFAAHALLANPTYSGAATTYALLSVSPSPASYAPFAIAPTTGDVLVGPAPLNGAGATLLFDQSLAYPLAPGLFQLTVAAVDRSGYFATGVVNVTINNIRPRASAVTVNISLASAAGAFAANLSLPAAVWTPQAYNRAGLRYSIAQVSTPNVNNALLQAQGVPAFVVNVLTGVVTVAPSITGPPVWNFAAQRSYAVPFTACDAVLSTLCGSATLTVNLVHVNQPPAWLPISPPIFAIEQTLGNVGLPLTSYLFDPDSAVNVAPPESFVFAIAGGNNQSTFSVNAATGQLSAVALTGSFVYSASAATTYLLNVTVTDAGIDGPRFTTWAIVPVTVTPLLAPPTLPSYSLSVVEHSTIGSLAYAGPGIGANTAILGVSPACPPSPNACPGNSFTYSLTPAPSAAFPFNITVLNSLPLASAQIAVVGGPIDYWVAGAPFVYTASLTLTETRAGVALPLTAMSTVTLTVARKNEPPYFAQGAPAIFSAPTATPSAQDGGAFVLAVYVNERAAPGTPMYIVAGAPLTVQQYYVLADDIAAGAATPAAVPAYSKDAALVATLAYSLPVASPLLAIGAAPSARLTVGAQQVPNFNSQRQFNVTVRATDTNGLSDTATVSVNIVDVDDAAVFVGFYTAAAGGTMLNGNTSAVNETAAVGTVLGYARFADQDVLPLWGAKNFALNLAPGPGGLAWVSGAPLFAINAATGAISVAGPLHYYDQPSFVLNGNAPP